MIITSSTMDHYFDYLLDVSLGKILKIIILLFYFIAVIAVVAKNLVNKNSKIFLNKLP